MGRTPAARRGPRSAPACHLEGALSDRAGAAQAAGTPGLGPEICEPRGQSRAPLSQQEPLGRSGEGRWAGLRSLSGTGASGHPGSASPAPNAPPTALLWEVLKEKVTQPVVDEVTRDTC